MGRPALTSAGGQKERLAASCTHRPASTSQEITVDITRNHRRSQEMKSLVLLLSFLLFTSSVTAGWGDTDSDGDGQVDAADEDDDNDGLLDVEDDDDDGDGVQDEDEDNDGDGLTNDEDDDDDGDGSLDGDEDDDGDGIENDEH